MERTSAFSAPEIVAVATAAASAVGGIVVGLSRAQANAARERLLAAQLREHPITARMDVPVERLKQAASSVAVRYPEVRLAATELSSRLGESTRPTIGRLSESASGQIAAARSGGSTVRDRIQESVAPVAVEALGTIKERVEEVSARSHQIAPAVAAAATTKADIAVSKTTGLAKETIATLGWLGAAVALIYYFVMTSERREQVAAFLATAFDQARLLAQDFQGYDEEL